MGKYFSFGQYNKNFKYIAFGCFFNILVNFIFGFDSDNNHNELLLFPSNGQKELYKHERVYDIFKSIGVFIFSCVFYKIETMPNKKEITSQRISSFPSIKSNNQIILIFNDLQDEMDSFSNLNILFLITIYVCVEYLSDIFYQLKLKIFDFWMFELLVISYINSKMFKLKIYKHQMFAIFFNSFICLLFRLPSFILSFSLEDEGNEKDRKSLYELNKWYIALGIFIYIMIITIRAYSFTKIKWFIDLKYISSTKLLIFVGFIGILISSISCIIQTNIECSKKINFCKIRYNDSSSYYLDNFGVYYEKISGLKNYEIIIEICVILFGMICKFFGSYFDILIIQYLTPVHKIFYSSIYYFIIKIIAIFYSKIKTNNFFNGKDYEKKFYIFLLDILGNIIAIFGFLIYLEIIELKFCKLNYNLKIYISKRSIDDLKQSNGYLGFNEEDEQSEKNKNSISSELESNLL